MHFAQISRQGKAEAAAAATCRAAAAAAARGCGLGVKRFMCLAAHLLQQLSMRWPHSSHSQQQQRQPKQQQLQSQPSLRLCHSPEPDSSLAACLAACLACLVASWDISLYYGCFIYGLLSFFITLRFILICNAHKKTTTTNAGSWPCPWSLWPG